MARPPKEGLSYFPHDTDAVNDEKVEALRMLYGNDGYAFYFILLERIYRTPDGELDVSDEETVQILSRKIDVPKEKFSQMLKTAIKKGCFDSSSFYDDKILTSNGVKKRIEPVKAKRLKMKELYIKRSVSGGVSAKETKKKPDKVKQRKAKKSKGVINLPPLALLWNDLCPSLPKTIQTTKDRMAKEKARLSERDVSEWGKVFRAIESSDFCRGLNDKGWRASFDWIVSNEGNAVKVLEGKYNGSKNGTGTKEGATKWNKNQWEIFKSGKWEHDRTRLVI